MEFELSQKNTAFFKTALENRLFFLILFIIFCSVMDYIFTLSHLASGYKELNPVMNYAFNLGNLPAFLFKYSLTGFGLIVLCSMSKYPLVRKAFNGIAAFYGILTAYHLYLYF